MSFNLGRLNKFLTLTWTIPLRTLALNANVGVNLNKGKSGSWPFLVPSQLWRVSWIHYIFFEIFRSSYVPLYTSQGSPLLHFSPSLSLFSKRKKVCFMLSEMCYRFLPCLSRRGEEFLYVFGRFCLILWQVCISKSLYLFKIVET